MTEDKRPCYCGTVVLETQDAAIVLNGTPICNLKCLRKAEEARLREIAKSAGEVS